MWENYWLLIYCTGGGGSGGRGGIGVGINILAYKYRDIKVSIGIRLNALLASGPLTTIAP